MSLNIKQANQSDKECFIHLSLQLCKFNRSNHKNECLYDNFEAVQKKVQKKAEEIFDYRNNDILILIAELNNEPVGYALSRLFIQDETADNGTGLMGFLDELFILDKVRGNGIGQKLIDQTIMWMKEKGIHRIKLHAYSWNHFAAKLYERNNFEPYVVSYEKFI